MAANNRQAVFALVLAAIALTGCSGGSSDDTPRTATGPPTSAASSPPPGGPTTPAPTVPGPGATPPVADPTSSTTAGSSGGQIPSAVPSKAATRCPNRAGEGDSVRLNVSVDLEGDGKNDAVYSNGVGGTLTVRFSRGGSTQVMISSQPVSVLGVEADGRSSEDELLAVYRGPIGTAKSTGSNAVLVDLADCALQVAGNQTGARYIFEVGRDNTGVLHGVSCKGSQLVGTTATVDRSTNRYRVTSVPVTIKSGKAVNGKAAKSSITATAANADTLSRATCNDRSPVGAPKGSG